MWELLLKSPESTFIKALFLDETSVLPVFLWKMTAMDKNEFTDLCWVRQNFHFGDFTPISALWAHCAPPQA